MAAAVVGGDAKAVVPPVVAVASTPRHQEKSESVLRRSGRGASRVACEASRRALALLPTATEAAVRQRCAQAAPFLPHALCWAVGLLLGRALGRRGRGGGATAGRRGTTARRGVGPLDAQLARADADSRAAAEELEALHAEMRRLSSGLSRARAAPGASSGDLSLRLEEAAAAYNTLQRVLTCERASAALTLQRAQLETQLLSQHLQEARENAAALLAAVEEANVNEFETTRRLMAAPIKPVQAPAQGQRQCNSAPQAVAQEALGSFTRLFGM